MTRLLSVYTKQSTMLKNKLHREAVLGQPISREYINLITHNVYV
jgi:hypothetical protein